MLNRSILIVVPAMAMLVAISCSRILGGDNREDEQPIWRATPAAIEAYRIGNLECCARISAGKVESCPMHWFPPEFPPKVRDGSESGLVVIDARIERDGTVTVLSILESRPDNRFDILASEAVRRWQFCPGESSRSTQLRVPIKMDSCVYGCVVE